MTDDVTASSPSFTLNEEEDTETFFRELILGYKLQAYLHRSLSQDTSVYYRIRASKTYGDTKETSPLSEGVTMAAPSASTSDNAVFCPGNRRDTSSPYQINTPKQLSQIRYHLQSRLCIEHKYSSYPMISLPYPAISMETWTEKDIRSLT